MSALNVYGVPVELTDDLVKIGKFDVNPPDDGDPDYLYVNFNGMYLTIWHDSETDVVKVTLTKFDNTDDYNIAALDSTGKTYSHTGRKWK